MPPTIEVRQRARLARVLAEFWAGGAGPTHGQVTDVLGLFGLDGEVGSKRDRVSEAIKSAESQDVVPLVRELIDLLRAHQMFSSDHAFAASQSAIAQLREALMPYQLGLSDDGHLKAVDGLSVSGATFPDIPALREHVGRMHRAITDDDTPLLIGSSKELLETASKLVLGRVGEPAPSNFPSLVNRALEVLMLHPKHNPSTQEDFAEPVRKILGGVLQISLGVNDLRNDQGTGHGRASASVSLKDRHAHLASGAAVVVATLMLDTLEAPDAPWCRERGQ